ncbi:MAG: hypothetical protein U5L96_21500 [Owenweeksia sp.]|nr:hypothetical protein [Owenweeksia sp.]
MHLLELEKLTSASASRKVIREHINETRQLAEDIFDELPRRTET